MTTRTKRVISIILSIILIFTVSTGVDLFVFAETGTNSFTIKAAKLETMFKLPSYHFNGDSNSDITLSNASGLSVGLANDRLFVAKINNDNTHGAIFYYKNLHTAKSNYQNNSSSKPTKIVYFDDGIIGHANCMTADSKYLYILKRSGDNQPVELVRISRSGIYNWNNGVVTTKNKTFGSSNTPIYKTFKLTLPNGDYYTSKVRSIARVKTESDGSTKFIIDRIENDLGPDTSLSNVDGKKGRRKAYCYATLSGNTFTMSDEPNDNFYLTIPFSGTYIYPDIYYSPNYGLFVSLWDYNGIAELGNTAKCVSYIMCYNLKDFTLNPVDNKTLFASYAIKCNGEEKFTNNPYTQYEIESISFVQHYNNKEGKDGVRLIFSVNAAGEAPKARDSIECITNSNQFLINF